MIENPCSDCEYTDECKKRIKKSFALNEIYECMFRKPKQEKKNCGIWIACDAEDRIKNGEYDWGDEEW